MINQSSGMKLFDKTFWRSIVKNNCSLDKHVAEVFRDPNKIMRSLKAGVKAALLQHKLAGNSVCVWRNNKVVWIPADEIPVTVKASSSKKNVKSKKVAVRARTKMSSSKNKSQPKLT
jgi:hypothetical protein